MTVDSLASLIFHIWIPVLVVFTKNCCPWTIFPRASLEFRFIWLLIVPRGTATPWLSTVARSFIPVHACGVQGRSDDRMDGDAKAGMYWEGLAGETRCDIDATTAQSCGQI